MPCKCNLVFMCVLPVALNVACQRPRLQLCLPSQGPVRLDHHMHEVLCEHKKNNLYLNNFQKETHDVQDASSTCHPDEAEVHMFSMVMVSAVCV